MWEDGWTVETMDGGWAANAEHASVSIKYLLTQAQTIHITEDGVEVLTREEL